jgi:hypothetical protein
MADHNPERDKILRSARDDKKLGYGRDEVEIRDADSGWNHGGKNGDAQSLRHSQATLSR